MEPTQVEMEPFVVAGIKTRTSNQEEMEPATARIGALWQQFFADNIQEQVSERNPDSPFYGVYYEFESDAEGPYTLLAGIQGTAGESSLAEVQIQEGTYLAFSASGPMPQTLLGLWGQVWEYFQNNPQIERSYGSDFEAYPSETEVTIHIGVK